MNSHKPQSLNKEALGMKVAIPVIFGGFPLWIALGAFAHHALTGFRHWDDDAPQEDQEAH